MSMPDQAECRCLYIATATPFRQARALPTLASAVPQLAVGLAQQEQRKEGRGAKGAERKNASGGA